MAFDPDKGVQVVTVGDLLDEPLSIPAYQRPYSWKASTAVQLLDDIRAAFRSQDSPEDRRDGVGGSYVLGAAILHLDEETDQIHVVDGQQRLLTLLMLLDLLGSARSGGIEVGAVRKGEGQVLRGGVLGFPPIDAGFGVGGCG